MLPGSQPRASTAAAIVEAVRRTGIAVRHPTGWEDYDAEVLGSFLIAGRIVTLGEPDGIIQMRVRRRLRSWALVAVVAIFAVSILSRPAAAALAAGALLELIRGWWRTGPVVRRAVSEAAATVVDEQRPASEPVEVVTRPARPPSLARIEP
jgi:hypothetical protein